MNYVREVEQVLYHYKDLEKSIENLRARIGRLDIGPSTSLTAKVNPSGVRGGGCELEPIDQLCEFKILLS